jgi:hypothetical protein
LIASRIDKWVLRDKYPKMLECEKNKGEGPGCYGKNLEVFLHNFVGIAWGCFCGIGELRSFIVNYECMFFCVI